MFYLDKKGQPTVIAGVPPDYFSKTGQLWGNPLYRWDIMKKDDYAWWIERFRAARNLVDFIRLDHFRGFEKYWEIPVGENTATNGRWVPGPGADFFRTIKKALGDLPLIAEDLGIITPEVHALRDQFDLPGMRVLQFAFGSPSGKDSYRPHNYPRNCVVYTGTHDNNTTIGWFHEAEVTTKGKDTMLKERRLALEYLGTEGCELNWNLIRLALMSVADTAIIPLQDVLGLGSEARMNTPSVTAGNWRWRFSWDMITESTRGRLKEMTETYGR
jgi:4-alpha-glucanotransferase